MTSAARVLCFVGVVILMAPPSIHAQGISLRISNGLVTLNASDVTVSQILERWAQVADVEIVNLGRLAGPPVTIQLTSVPERSALAVLLRDASGYILGARQGGGAGSAIARIILLPHSVVQPRSAVQPRMVSTPPQPSPAGPPPPVFFRDSDAEPDNVDGRADDPDSARAAAAAPVSEEDLRRSTLAAAAAAGVRMSSGPSPEAIENALRQQAADAEAARQPPSGPSRNPYGVNSRSTRPGSLAPSADSTGGH